MGAKFLQMGAGALVGIAAVEGLVRLQRGSGTLPLLSLALLGASALLQVWTVGITLERRVGIGAVMTAMGASIILLTLALAGDIKSVIEVGLVPLAFVAVARARRWLPISTGERTHGPTLAIPAWCIWSRHLFWVVAALMFVAFPFFALVSLFKAHQPPHAAIGTDSVNTPESNARLDPQLASTYDNQGGRFLYQQKDYDKALADYNEAIRLDPQLASAYAGRGWVYMQRKDYDKALADYNEAIRLDPKLASAYTGRGWVYYEQKDYDKALADYNEAIRLDPQLASAYNSRGLVYYEQKDYGSALANYNEAILLDPQLASAYNGRGWVYYALEDYAKALVEFNEAIPLDPQLAGAYTGRGSVYVEQKGYDKAISDYTEAIRLKPNNAYAYEGRAIAYRKLGKKDKASADSEGETIGTRKLTRW